MPQDALHLSFLIWFPQHPSGPTVFTPVLQIERESEGKITNVELNLTHLRQDRELERGKKSPGPLGSVRKARSVGIQGLMGVYGCVGVGDPQGNEISSMFPFAQVLRVVLAQELNSWTLGESQIPGSFTSR